MAIAEKIRARKSLPIRRSLPTARWPISGWDILGAALVLSLGAKSAWDAAFWQVGKEISAEFTPLISITGVICLATAIICRQFSRYPRVQATKLRLLAIAISFTVVLTTVALFRFEYSRTFLLTTFVGEILWSIGLGLVMQRERRTTIALVPGGVANELESMPGLRCTMLTDPEEPVQAEMVAIDYHAHAELDAEWVRLLAHYTLMGVPVLHAAALRENVTGRASLTCLSHGMLGGLEISPIRAIVKRAFDLFVVILSAPIAIPVMVISAILIKLTSRGPILFFQERMGEANRPFRLVKFRTMRADAERQGAQFASRNDDRTTSIGRWMRRLRIDELPQYWNILKGEMSLIGPRPEQVKFALEFEESIPFYAYRHMLKPGITGWAQVSHGYAADTNETQTKLEFDLYYLKHQSLAMDSLIVFRTLQIMMTGFGAR